jgi:hypothetical protein
MAAKGSAPAGSGGALGMGGVALRIGYFNWMVRMTPMRHCVILDALRWIGSMKGRPHLFDSESLRIRSSATRTAFSRRGMWLAAATESAAASAMVKIRVDIRVPPIGCENAG